MTSKPKRQHRYNQGRTLSAWREALNQIVFGSETAAGRRFDIALIVAILLSILVVMLDSVADFQQRYATAVFWAEWLFTGLFTLEYALRLICVRRPWLYARSFFGIVDLLSILPAYLGLLLPGSEYMLTLRILRLLRIFRVLKLSEYLEEADILVVALVNSLRKITVFLYAVLTLVVVFGTLMYVVEGPAAGFTSIPKAVYWAIVTITTVGYGDIAPKTPVGQMIASTIMIMGYGIIAVPTGIYSAELLNTRKNQNLDNRACRNCGAASHDFDAAHCKYCGHRLDE
ncbi:ion transporter [Methylomonas fluvii]|uniref:Ion transporter n=1 Tax=Methylomonas fluvii TaxID=1854564 RepID=A0ABR9DFY5_9GAMM|nr:ion transporter [Methylomonas fluvii]MBD9362009.1 ion transporter [Methylomonas fluvii]CAD6875048.1 Potassium voltage-gated channel subfamily KQT; possible potassium channel, VIC family [Methylomonas fluvii]